MQMTTHFTAGCEVNKKVPRFPILSGRMQNIIKFYDTPFKNFQRYAREFKSCLIAVLFFFSFPAINLLARNLKGHTATNKRYQTTWYYVKAIFRLRRRRIHHLRRKPTCRFFSRPTTSSNELCRKEKPKKSSHVSIC